MFLSDVLLCPSGSVMLHRCGVVGSSPPARTIYFATCYQGGVGPDCQLKFVGPSHQLYGTHSQVGWWDLPVGPTCQVGIISYTDY
jgi:hypothetical protein